MTVIELKTEIKEKVDTLSEPGLNEILGHIKNILQKEQRAINAKRILNENHELFGKLAK